MITLSNFILLVDLTLAFVNNGFYTQCKDKNSQNLLNITSFPIMFSKMAYSHNMLPQYVNSSMYKILTHFQLKDILYDHYFVKDFLFKVMCFIYLIKIFMNQKIVMMKLFVGFDLNLPLYIYQSFCISLYLKNLCICISHNPFLLIYQIIHTISFSFVT